MSHVIRIDTTGALSVDGQILPGQITGLSVGGKMVIDKAQAEGSSGKKKSFSGFDDSAISIELTLYEPIDGRRSRYEHLKVLNGAFKALENRAPIVYSVQGAIFDSFDVRHVLFSSLSADDLPDADALSVSLKFTEHDPLVSLIQAQQGDQDERTLKEPEESEETPSGVTAAERQKILQIEALHG